MSEHTPGVTPAVGLGDGFTSGPWRWQIDDGGFGHVVDRERWCRRYLVGANGQGFAQTAGLTAEIDAANADLIAAAPSLLEAADAAIAYDAAIQRAASQGKSWVEGDDLDVLYADWIDKARLAIAKARALQPDSGPS